VVAWGRFWLHGAGCTQRRLHGGVSVAWSVAWCGCMKVVHRGALARGLALVHRSNINRHASFRWRAFYHAAAQTTKLHQPGRRYHPSEPYQPNESQTKPNQNQTKPKPKPNQNPNQTKPNQTKPKTRPKPTHLDSSAADARRGASTSSCSVSPLTASRLWRRRFVSECSTWREGWMRRFTEPKWPGLCQKSSSE